MISKMFPIITYGLGSIGIGSLGSLGVTLSSSPALTTIASTIQTVEGYYPGTYAYVNNNPGNLVYVGQAGATLGSGGFASFPTYDAGYQALLNQIQLYANKGMTIQDMMNVYAPAGQGGNNPTSYANTVATALGVSPDTLVSDALAGNATAGISLSISSITSDGSSTDSLFSSLSTISDPISQLASNLGIDPTTFYVGLGISALTVLVMVGKV
jgi:hypothetical protein